MKIQIILDGAVIATATLDKNDSANDFATLLPLTLHLKDYTATEKIAELPRKLAMNDAPESYGPLTGDISFYAPWGNLAIFYKNGHLSSGLVRLGRLDSSAEVMAGDKSMFVTIERVEF